MTEARIFDLRLPAITLDSGQRVSRHQLRGWVAGPPASMPTPEMGLCYPPAEACATGEIIREPPEASAAQAALPKWPTILVVHALTADARVGGEGGWWPGCFGPGCSLDPREHRILCLNNIGSCYGSSGPGWADFPGMEVTAWDQARSLWMALDALGLEELELVIGGSLGAMIGLCMACLAPARIKRLLPAAAAQNSSPWVIALNHVQRETMRLDPKFPDVEGRTLALARQLAQISYRAEPGLIERHGRRRAADGQFEVQRYLEHQGDKLVSRYDPRAYLAMMYAMDSFDLSEGPKAKDPEERWVAPERWGVGAVKTSTLSVGIDTDELYLAHHMEQLAVELQAEGVVAEYAALHSPHGHDAFLIEAGQMNEMVRRALALPS